MSEFSVMSAAPMHPVTGRHVRLWIRDMESGERTEIPWATRMVWTVTPDAVAQLRMDLIDVPETRDVDPTGHFFGVYLDLPNGQTFGPFYFGTVEAHEAKGKDGLDTVTWELAGPFYDAPKGSVVGSIGAAARDSRPG